MKIAVNTRFLLKGKMEGIGRFTYEVLRRIVAEHPEDEFIFFFDRKYDPAFVFAPNVTPVVLFPPARHPFLFIWWFEYSLSAALKKYQPDVFLSTDNFCVLNTKVPTVLVMHDIAYTHFPELVSKTERWYYQKYTPRFIQRAERIVTVSEFTRDDILTQFPVPESKFDIACNGCDPHFRPLPDSEQEKVREQFTAGLPYFIYVGAIHPRKNVHRLIWAFEKFKMQTQSPAKLVIVGREAWMTDQVRKIYEANAYKKDILFTGYVAREALPKLMASALALVYPSLLEGFGIPVLEAMYAEVPIITSNVSSLPEVAGKAAIYVNPNFVKEIANAMILIWESEELRQNLVERGREQRQRFTWEKAAEVVYKNLEEAVAGD